MKAPKPPTSPDLAPEHRGRHPDRSDPRRRGGLRTNPAEEHLPDPMPPPARPASRSWARRMVGRAARGHPNRRVVRRLLGSHGVTFRPRIMKAWVAVVAALIAPEEDPSAAPNCDLPHRRPSLGPRSAGAHRRRHRPVPQRVARTDGGPTPRRPDPISMTFAWCEHSRRSPSSGGPARTADRPGARRRRPSRPDRRATID